MVRSFHEGHSQRQEEEIRADQENHAASVKQECITNSSMPDILPRAASLPATNPRFLGFAARYIKMPAAIPVAEPEIEFAD
jgi:hypothetical protein